MLATTEEPEIVKIQNISNVKVRDQKLDLLKSISAILVVLFHAGNIIPYANVNSGFIIYFNRFLQVFANLGVPIFFVVSGYLASSSYQHGKEWYLLNIRKKTKALAVPYLIWIFAYWVVEYLVLSPPVNWNFKDIMIAWIGIPFSTAPIYNPLWFVRDLYLVTFLLPILKFLSKHTRITLVFCLLVWYSPFVYEFKETFAWYTLGLLIYNKKEQWKPIFLKIKQYGWLFLIVGLFGNLVYSYLFSNEKFFYTLIILWVLLLWSFVQYNENNYKVFDFLNQSVFKASFLIFVGHGKILSLMQMVYCKIAGNQEWILLPGYIILPILSIIICICADRLLRKTPIYSLITGNRC